jgi:hypothetical protein
MPVRALASCMVSGKRVNAARLEATSPAEHTMKGKCRPMDCAKTPPTAGPIAKPSKAD